MNQNLKTNKNSWIEELSKSNATFNVQPMKNKESVIEVHAHYTGTNKQVVLQYYYDSKDDFKFEAIIE